MRNLTAAWPSRRQSPRRAGLRPRRRRGPSGGTSPGAASAKTGWSTPHPPGQNHRQPDYPWLRFFEKGCYDQGVPGELAWWAASRSAHGDRRDPSENKKNHVCFHGTSGGFGLCSLGLVDVFRKHRPGGILGLQGPQLPRGNIGWRIDHILATAPLAEQSIDLRRQEPRAWKTLGSHRGRRRIQAVGTPRAKRPWGRAGGIHRGDACGQGDQISGSRP